MTSTQKGLKFFTATGGLEKRDIAQILETATTLCVEAGVTLSECELSGCELSRNQQPTDRLLSSNRSTPFLSTFCNRQPPDDPVSDAAYVLQRAVTLPPLTAKVGTPPRLSGRPLSPPAQTRPTNTIQDSQSIHPTNTTRLQILHDIISHPPWMTTPPPCAP
jgi:hypothetical protein